MTFVRRTGWIALIASLASGCATSYATRTAAPEQELQWPFAPRAAKLTYERSLSGFEPGRRGSFWRGLVYGRDGGEHDAFVLPVAVAVAADRRIAVADLGRRCVHLFDPATGRYLRIEGADRQPLVSPVALTFDDTGGLWVSDSAGWVLRFDRDGKPTRRLDHAGSERLERPTGLAFDPVDQRLYVVDTLASRVFALAPDGQLQFSFGGRGAGTGELNFPTHIARAAGGELYVTDALNFRIQIFDRNGRPLAEFGRHGDGSGDLAMPKGVAVDEDGVIYVVDGLFDNVQLFDRGGDFLLTLGGRGTGFGEFWLPSGIYLSAADELYVCDTYNHRIQVFQVARGYADGAS